MTSSSFSKSNPLRPIMDKSFNFSFTKKIYLPNNWRPSVVWSTSLVLPKCPSWMPAPSTRTMRPLPGRQPQLPSFSRLWNQKIEITFSLQQAHTPSQTPQFRLMASPDSSEVSLLDACSLDSGCKTSSWSQPLPPFSVISETRNRDHFYFKRLTYRHEFHR